MSADTQYASAVAMVSQGQLSRAANLVQVSAGELYRHQVVRVACANPAYVYGRVTRKGLDNEGNCDRLPPKAINLVYGGLRAGLRRGEAYALNETGFVLFKRLDDVQWHVI